MSKTTATDHDVIWGAEAIGAFINRSPRQTFYMLKKGGIDADKHGDKWCTTKQRLRRQFGIDDDMPPPKADKAASAVPIKRRKRTTTKTVAIEEGIPPSPKEQVA